MIFHDRVKVSVEDHVALVTLDRAEKMNALDDQMLDGLIAAGQAVSQNPGVRSVVLTGDGRAFCAGLDMGSFTQMAGEGGKNNFADYPLATRKFGISNRPQFAVWVWKQCRVPVVCAVHGSAFGGGFQLCLGADLRIVAPDTKLSIMEIKWGLIPDMAGTALMHELARGDIIRKLTYTGEIFSGAQALEYGFATETADQPLQRAIAIAKSIANHSPTAIRAAKAIFNRVGLMSDEDKLQQESTIQDGIMGAEHQTEAVLAAMEKRTAAFRDIP